MKLQSLCALLALGVPALAAAQAAPGKGPPPSKQPPAAAFPPAAPAAPAAVSSSNEQPGEPPQPPPGAAPAQADQRAQPSSVPPPPPPPAGYYYGPYPYPYYYAPPQPAPAPAQHKSAAKFYMSFGIGPGLLTGSNSSTNAGTFKGADVSGHLLLGARPSSLLVLGGGFVHDQIFALSSKPDIPSATRDLSSTSMTINMLCFFAEWTPESAPGLHFPTYMGVGALTQNNGANSITSQPTVFLLGAGVGYEFALGGHFRLGPLLRADFGNFQVNQNSGAEDTVFVPALMLTATYDAGR